MMHEINKMFLEALANTFTHLFDGLFSGGTIIILLSGIFLLLLILNEIRITLKKRKKK